MTSHTDVTPARPVNRRRLDPSPGARFRRLQRDDGYVMAMMGLLIVPLVIVTAFATDVGQWYAQAAQMQRTADAAALAGVVWIGDKTDPNRYRTEALKVADQNGFGDGDTVNGSPVTVTVTKVPPNRLRVTIDARAMVFFGPAAGKTRQDLERSAAAEFNLSVPLGSPRNFLGTGNLGKGAVGTPYQREGLWMAISGYCTDKQQGDRIAAAYSGGPSGGNGCTGAQNPEFSDVSYELYIDLPTTRAYATNVLIFNGNFSTNTGASSCPSYASRNPTLETCPGNLAGKARQPTTFTLYRADSTPLDDTDNPTMASVNGCGTSTAGINGTKTFDARTDGNSDTNFTFNPSASLFDGSSVWNSWWNMCTIPSTALGGRYILRVRAQASTAGVAAQNNGSNAYGVVANRSTTQALCDSRTDITCPRVYAKDYLSVFATQSGLPQFFLAEIGPEHAGKRVLIKLWDPAEGATELRIRRPTGCSTWAYQTFDWTDGSNSGTGVDRINITSFSFNNRSVDISFRLPTTYSPALCNQWYQVEYAFSPGASDRTTWSLEILGDPVHLIE